MAETDDHGYGPIHFDRMGWETVKAGLQTKSVTIGGQTLRMGSYGSGFVEDFWCEDSHTGFVHEGRLTIQFDSGLQHYKAGEAFFIPPGKATRHKVSQPLGQAAVVFIASPT